MTSVDMGLFGLDCFVTDKDGSSSSLPSSDICIEEFENLLQDSATQNILDMSLQESGITETVNNMNHLQVRIIINFAISFMCKLFLSILHMYSVQSVIIIS